nr:MAG TPA: hypothetical protein [Caudoviricetes sp.]
MNTATRSYLWLGSGRWVCSFRYLFSHSIEMANLLSVRAQRFTYTLIRFYGLRTEKRFI